MKASLSSDPVSRDKILQRAREIWERRGSPWGQDEEIWYEAEHQLQAEKTRAAGGNGTPLTFDAEKVEERLDDMSLGGGGSGQRSPTSLDVT